MTDDRIDAIVEEALADMSEPCGHLGPDHPACWVCRAAILRTALRKAQREGLLEYAAEMPEGWEGNAQIVREWTRRRFPDLEDDHETR